jgi:hypothetical protein
MHKRENEQIFLLYTSTHMLQLRKITKRKIHIKQYYIFYTNHDLVEINFWLSFALFHF